MLNLDTHIVVAVLNGSLDERELALVAVEPLAISDIVLWELGKLIQLKRLKLDLDARQFHDFLRNTLVVPISLQIVRKSTQLDFKSDPADELIAATSIVEEIPLLTRDARILKSKIVPFAEL
jgi:PIN domain nuclease of toxin-antitoxin system